ncbi:EcsC family protein [Spirosoma luteolum]
MDLLQIVNAVSPPFSEIKKEVEELRKNYPSKSKSELAELYGNRIRTKYTSIGVTSALPSIIPGFGTAAQAAVELGTISADLALMFRWMGAICYGTAFIFGKDIEAEFDQEFITVLGLESGAIVVSKNLAAVIGGQIAKTQFKRHFPKKVLGQINKVVGVRLLTKFGTKRGSIALGKLIPFGVGALVAGTMNYFTIDNFKREAIKYFGSDDNTEYALVE